MSKAGGIPATLVMFEQPERQKQLHDGKLITVRPAYVGDNERDWCHTKGKEWAEGYSYRSCDPNLIRKTVFPNEPFTNLRVISVEHRGQGGVAYKVVTEGNQLVDLREDVILDTMLTMGIKKGGLLRGKFVWARNGSQIRIVRVGSTLHKELAKAQALADAKVPHGKIKNQHLVAGTVYRRPRDGQTAVFLGHVTRQKPSNGYWTHRKPKPEKYLAWAYLAWSEDLPSTGTQQDAYALCGPLTVTKSQSYIETLGTIEMGKGGKLRKLKAKAHYDTTRGARIHRDEFTWT